MSTASVGSAVQSACRRVREDALARRQRPGGYHAASPPARRGFGRRGAGLRAAYQAISLRSRKNRPEGPPLGNVAHQTIVSAPCATERGAAGPPISERTQPGSTELTSTSRPRAAEASRRVSAFSAAFERE